MKRESATRNAISVVILTALAVGLVFEIQVCRIQVQRATSVKEFVHGVRVSSLTEFPLKMQLVCLNGAFVRSIGQHQCNDVVRMDPDDLLLRPNERRTSMAGVAHDLKVFSDFCASNDAAFAYIQLPKKLDVLQSMLPPGKEDGSYANADDLLHRLRMLEVPLADWRQAFSATPADVAKNFYRTDHHWNTDASFRAAGLLVDEICRRCRVSPSDADEARTALLPGRWKRKVLPQIFLGALGKRTGPCFAGCDDVVMLKPGFDTQIKFEVPSKHIRVRGSFKKTIMRRSGELKGKSDQFVSDAYSLLYVGGLYPFARSINDLAPLDLRVMLIGDSYARPVSAFASVAVRELIMVDPRRRSPKAPSLADLVRRERPDVVIQMLNPSSLLADRMTGRKTGRQIMFEYGL